MWRTGPGPLGVSLKQCPKAPRRVAGRGVGPYHTVQATHGPGLRPRLAELAEVAVVVQVYSTAASFMFTPKVQMYRL